MRGRPTIGGVDFRGTRGKSAGIHGGAALSSASVSLGGAVPQAATGKSSSVCNRCIKKSPQQYVCFPFCQPRGPRGGGVQAAHVLLAFGNGERAGAGNSAAGMTVMRRELSRSEGASPDLAVLSLSCREDSPFVPRSSVARAFPALVVPGLPAERPRAAGHGSSGEAMEDRVYQRRLSAISSPWATLGDRIGRQRDGSSALSSVLHLQTQPNGP